MFVVLYLIFTGTVFYFDFFTKNLIMAIHIQSGKEKIKTNLKAKVQSLPFKIEADCDAQVKNYFDKHVKKDEDDGRLQYFIIIFTLATTNFHDT